MFTILAKISCTNMSIDIIFREKLLYITFIYINMEELLINQVSDCTKIELSGHRKFFHHLFLELQKKFFFLKLKIELKIGGKKTCQHYNVLFPQYDIWIILLCSAVAIMSGIFSVHFSNDTGKWYHVIFRHIIC